MTDDLIKCIINENIVGKPENKYNIEFEIIIN